MVYDIAIIGAGPGGYNAAVRAAKNGASVIIFEKDEPGGVCLNNGCIPTKTLLKSAMLFKDIKKAQNYGINVENAEISLEKVIERKSKVVNTLKNGVSALLKSNKVEYVKAAARINDLGKIAAGDSIVQAKSIIVACGSSTAVPHIPGIQSDYVIFSDQALDLENIPSSLVIIGGGVIGLEFASFFNQLGTKVTIIELRDAVLPGFDNEIAAEITKLLTRTGIEIITGALVKEIKNDTVIFEKAGEIGERKGGKILVSVGRVPNTKGLFSEKLNIKMERGYIVTDESMCTNVQNIYAIGDVNGRDMLAHVATAEGLVAADNACGIKKSMSYDAIPKCVYTAPEISAVGMTEEEAISKEFKIKKSKVLVRTNGRAHADGNIDGFAKVIADGDTGKILGVHIISPYATEIISEAVLAVSKGLTSRELEQVIHAHPTVSEIFGDAVLGL